MLHKTKPAESYKADFSKINKIFLARVILTAASFAFGVAWLAYWSFK